MRMNRRDFLKTTLATAALGAMHGGLPVFANEIAGTAVTRRKFSAGKTLPLLGFGMMRLPIDQSGKIDAVAAKKMVAKCFAAGLNYFDTAYMYHGGESEKFVGQALSAYPRESFYLASKMPVWMAKNAADMERIFNEQLTRCQTPYFDFYMLHSLDRRKCGIAREYRAYEFLQKKKAEGKIRHIGFSFHDRPEVLAEIVKTHPWEFAQIQLNYLDWELYRSREQYEILTQAKIPVIVMEPLRGGSLATLSKDAEAILRAQAPKASPASWALRYAAALPNVITVLSGMSAMWQLEDNLHTFTPFAPLTAAERDTLNLALAAYRKCLDIPCTSCRYCLPCPVGVAIPKIFGIYNQYKASGNKWLFNSAYNSIPESARAEACVNCGRCTKVCPQHIDIPGKMKQIAAVAAQIAKEMK